MNEVIHRVGIDLSLTSKGVDINFDVSFDSTTLYIVVASCQLDLAQTAKERFNDLNVVLPEGSGRLMAAKFTGSVSKTNIRKVPDPAGEYRLLTFEGEMESITLPIPVLSDINIDKAYFYYQYLSAKSTGSGASFTNQVIFLGCAISVKSGTNLAKALTGVKLRAAYFLSNNATILYADFSGTIHIGDIINAIFGVTVANLIIDVQSAGIFQIAKKNTPPKPQPPDSQTPDNTKESADPAPQDTGVSYLDAINQIANLKGQTAAPPADVPATGLLPMSFPLEQTQVTVNGKQVTKTGIKAGNSIDTDFTDQFTQAFSDDNVKGICFWVIINLNQISFFNNLITIGYSDTQLNSLVLYGFKTTSTSTGTGTGPDTNAGPTTGKDQREGTSKGAPPLTAAYFYARLPAITLFNFLTFSGLNGRQGILFKYSSAGDQYELNGAVSFTAFSKTFIFGGDLTTNNDQLTAMLDITVSSPQVISEPLGMTGVNLAKLFLYVKKIFAKPADGDKPAVSAKLTVAAGGYVDFNFGGTSVQLAGNVVFDNSEARLVLIALKASPVLTLSNFVQEVISKSWNWLDTITQQIGFISGEMYYLKPPADKSSDPKYTFAYDSPVQTPGTVLASTTSTFTAGYHIHAEMLLFGKYVFLVDLSVQTDGITLSGSYEGTFDGSTITKATTLSAFFISIDSPVLQISTVNESSHFKIEIDHVRIFNTDLGSTSVDYSDGTFTGTYTYPSPHIGFEWQWTKGQNSGGFSITRIDGLDSQFLKVISQMTSYLNSMGSGCESILDSMFDKFESSFTPGLQQGQSPAEDSNGTMKVPLAIAYVFSIQNTEICRDSINLSLDVTIPTSFSNLPDALFDTLTGNMDSVIAQLMQNTTVYKAIALEMAKKGFAALAARMLCRVQGTPAAAELSGELEAAIEAGEILAELGAMLELEGVITLVFTAGIAVAVAGLLGILEKVWDAVKSAFGGSSGKKDAQNKLDNIKDSVSGMISSITARLNSVAASIQITQLNVGIDQTGNYVARWDLPDNPDLGENGNLFYQLTLLEDKPGSGTAASSPYQLMDTFQVMNGGQNSTPWTTIIETDSQFQMNAAVQTTIKGYSFMTRDAENNLDSTIGTLDQIGDNLDGAVDFNNQLKAFRTTMQGYNRDGLTSKKIYARVAGPGQFIIGQSALGVNTQI